uniref:Uncharacterized protein n=1 Tax=Cucumis melo TaxID=3656 RepID=A0A9I9EHF4_CUCME
MVIGGLMQCADVDASGDRVKYVGPSINDEADKSLASTFFPVSTPAFLVKLALLLVN